MMKQRQKPKLQYSEYNQLLNKDSDNSDEDTELYIRNAYKEVPTTEKVVEEGDTLQALSIKYHCSISELKRLNTIHRENEIFAKRTIKVPLRPFTMALATVHTSGSTTPHGQPDSNDNIDTNSLKNKLSEQLSTVPSTSTDDDGGGGDVELNTVIFNSKLKPTPRNMDQAIENPLINEVPAEQIRLIPRSVPPENVVSRLSCSGADADISWVALIVCIVIVIIAVPLIYVFYIYEHPEKYHHDHDHNS